MRDHKFFRCTKCRRFWIAAKVAFKACISCQLVAYRCEDCGGLMGACRSVHAHMSWYAGRGSGIGGHTKTVANEFKRECPKDTFKRVQKKTK